MSIDIVTIIDEVGATIAAIVLFFLISRAIMIGRNFVGGVYRSRAFWFAGVMLVALELVLSTLAILLFGLYPSTSLSWLGIISFLAFLLVMFVYADSTILVTLEMDFLHRNTLHWRPVRTLAYAAIFANILYLAVLIFLTNPPPCVSSGQCSLYVPGVPSWIQAIFLYSIALYEVVPVALVTYAYSITAVIIGARSTSDMTMKRHVRWLGLSFIIFFVAFVVSFFVNGVPFISTALLLVLVYTFYRALMSLTSIGRLKAEAK
jgi:hypothetical protein